MTSLHVVGMRTHTLPSFGVDSWQQFRRRLVMRSRLTDLVILLIISAGCGLIAWRWANSAAAALLLLVLVALVRLVDGRHPHLVDTAATATATPVAIALILTPLTLIAASWSSAPVDSVWLIASLGVGAAAMVVARLMSDAGLRRARLDGHGLRRTLVILGEGSDPILLGLRRHPVDGFNTIGYFSSGLDVRSAASPTPVRSTRQIARAVLKEDVDVVLAVGAVIPEDLVTVMRGIEGSGVSLIVMPGLRDVVPDRIRPLTVSQGWTAALEVRTRRTRAFMKSVIDRVVGSVLLLIAAPILAAAAIAIRLDSPGPAFYTQTRVGLNGTHFKLFKLRSMYTDADAKRAALVERGGDSGNTVMFKDSNDPRITRVGKFIRRYSIDELPQLLNVVTGDMSLVGPRPALPEEVAKYDSEADRRLLVKPGLTGLWQVSGRSDLSWESTVALDQHYVDNRGARLDSRIFVKTVEAVLSGRGAR
ncbi:exopolysaccharide biosynthesis polyprenyl glycosylphosphotransferase [Actinomyces mediterranea]|uniref:exopolysaccharide biosynthesis polyprenyl glycosylphosphotransferase n=1 Tax=Actinomyces mediterranea TaxID=1871028 RepID=UPI001F17BCCF|nr:exopolysaccharide biosynthesis polyprenyl glycosylphosphotransferase [Actinomyces mediterranea]